MQVVLEMEKPESCKDCSLCEKGMCIPNKIAVPNINCAPKWCPLKNEGLTNSAALLKRLAKAIKSETRHGVKINHSSEVIFSLNDAGAFFKQQEEAYFIILDKKNNMIGCCCIDRIDKFCEEPQKIKLIKLNKQEYFAFCSNGGKISKQQLNNAKSYKEMFEEA